ncbi:deoxyribonuclease-1 [Succinivibrio dextrinosolvens]|uniref:endonuclease n=1 Tax=Succinivibrio dextrinosolvens TaxID=83771 RepID=UPI0008F4233B|nr:endonuclease [Succinivibrio dextrinosolvens]SFS84844.1 deoxyribonuclease-1 [Succinivibrio dextrinosolvens]
MRIPVTLFALLLFLPSAMAQSDERPANFREAKKQMVIIFSKLNRPTTLYCGCDIIFPKSGGYKPDLQSCGYQIAGDYERGNRIEAEHIVPVWEFAHKMNCWKSVEKGKGRSNCEDTDQIFNLIESDLHNLYPAIGEINKDRSSYAFVDKLSDADNPEGYGQCRMYFNKNKYLVQPTARSRGIIARAYLYMNARYNLPLDLEHLRLYRQWSRTYKVDDNECKRNYMIKRIQGNDNPFVTEQCELRIKHPHSGVKKESM